MDVKGEKKSSQLTQKKHLPKPNTSWEKILRKLEKQENSPKAFMKNPQLPSYWMVKDWKFDQKQDQYAHVHHCYSTL